MAKQQNASLRELCIQVADASIAVTEEFFAFFRFLNQVFRSGVEVCAHPSKLRWSGISVNINNCGSDALPIISLLGFLIGFILAFQAIIQLGRFGVESYVVNLVGTVVVTELSPLVTAVVLAGRTGSSFAAELGSMKSEEEIDAMYTMGIDVNQFLVLPKLLALLVVTPGLTVISSMCGICGGMSVVCSMLDFSTAEYMTKTFDVVQVVDLSQGLIKSLVFGVVVALIGCMKGLNSARNAQAVGKATTSAVVTAIFMIVVIDAAITAAFGVGTR